MLCQGPGRRRLVSQVDLDTAIRTALSGLAVELGVEGPQPNGRGGFHLQDRGVSFGLLGTPRTHEIELWMEAPDWEASHIPSDAILEWLGDPARGYQFNDSNFSEIATALCEIGRRAFLAFREDRRGALRALADAEARIIDRSLLAERRREANRAWEQGDYARAKRLYSEMSGSLTPVEAKRFQIAARK